MIEERRRGETSRGASRDNRWEGKQKEALSAINKVNAGLLQESETRRGN